MGSVMRESRLPFGRDAVRCALIGVPTEDGVVRRGCADGPDAYRAAGIGSALANVGCRVIDLGNLQPAQKWSDWHANPAVRNLGSVAAWTEALQRKLSRDIPADALPILLGGDHSIAMGAISGLAERAKEAGSPLFLLWLDAHPDIHTLDSTTTGNLHGVPISYLIGERGFSGYLPENPAPLDPRHICMMGVRSVDPAERDLLSVRPVQLHGMSAIRRHGPAKLLGPFLRQVRDAGGRLHVSLDVDFLDPSIAPGVNTSVPNGATLDEARTIVELVRDSGLLASLDLVELNPRFDKTGRTAEIMVGLVALMLGNRVPAEFTPACA